MARKIESLLRVISDMQRFESAEWSTQNCPKYFPSDELTEDELDLVTAAVKEPAVPDFMRGEK